ncbi:MAG: hypothetical protein OJI67_12455, partial [Prosthecobacter sp.]|nr:hypothetical protein [Prosthecobacter sp.]
KAFNAAIGHLAHWPSGLSLAEGQGGVAPWANIAEDTGTALASCPDPLPDSTPPSLFLKHTLNNFEERVAP